MAPAILRSFGRTPNGPWGPWFETEQVTSFSFLDLKQGIYTLSKLSVQFLWATHCSRQKESNSGRNNETYRGWRLKYTWELPGSHLTAACPRAVPSANQVSALPGISEAGAMVLSVGLIPLGQLSGPTEVKPLRDRLSPAHIPNPKPSLP